MCMQFTIFQVRKLCMQAGSARLRELTIELCSTIRNMAENCLV